MSAENVAVGLWVVWYVTWVAAVVWSSKTKVQMGKDMAGLHRYLAGIGCLLLFFPHGANGALFGWAFTRPLMRTLWPEPAALKWSLLVLVAVGFGFCWWARLHLGRLWSGFVTLKEDHRIVDTGPYRLVRHPIYTGVIFSALMTALIKSTPVALLGFLLVATGFWLTARIEETFLRGQLGAEAYDAYSRKVPMLVPGFG